MRILFLAMLSVLAFTIYSCQKQLGWQIDPLTGKVMGDTSQNGPGSKELLISVVAVTGSEKVTTSYSYDSAGHLMSDFQSGTIKGLPLQLYRTFNRDTTGRINKITTVNHKAAGGKDTVNTFVYYDDPASLLYQYAVVAYKVAATVVRDSTLYIYDGNGNIGLTRVFRSYDNSAGVPALSFSNEYAYASGNLVGRKTYGDTSGTGNMQVIATQKLSYDRRLNPMRLNAEAILINAYHCASKNNVIGVEVNDVVRPASNYTSSTIITYNMHDKPLRATENLMPLGQITTYTYNYR